MADKATLYSIELENSFMFEGGRCQVMPEDDHKAHIEGHKEGCSHCDQNAQEHIRKHEAMLKNG